MGGAFQRAPLVRNELCKFWKRAARWDVDGLAGSAAGINYGNVGYFAAAPAQPQCLVRMVMMMI